MGTYVSFSRMSKFVFLQSIVNEYRIMIFFCVHSVMACSVVPEIANATVIVREDLYFPLELRTQLDVSCDVEGFYFNDMETHKQLVCVYNETWGSDVVLAGCSC